VNPSDTVIAIDLHGVLFRHDYKKMVATAFKSKQKLTLIRALLSPSLWKDIIKLIRKGAVAEEFLVGLAETHQRLKPFVQLGITIANQQRPNESLIQLLKQLKKQGYELYLFSNIGSIIFDDLRKKFPTIFNMFKSFTVPEKSTGYIRKPNSNAFRKYLETNNLTKKKIILIDDKNRNVQAAQQQGIHAILFRSVDQLEQELKTIDLLDYTNHNQTAQSEKKY